MKHCSFSLLDQHVGTTGLRGFSCPLHSHTRARTHTHTHTQHPTSLVTKDSPHITAERLQGAGRGLSPWTLAGFGRGTEETGSGACSQRGVSCGEGKGPDRAVTWPASGSQGRPPRAHRICSPQATATEGLGGLAAALVQEGCWPDFHMAGISSRNVG